MARVLRIDKKLPTTWHEALSGFILFKQAQGISPRTVWDYEYHITLLFKRHPEAWDPAHLRKAVLQHMAQPMAPATFNLRRTYLKEFFAWGVNEGIFPGNPLNGLPKKPDEGRVRCIDETVLGRLLTLPNQKTFTGLRDFTLILLSLDTGIRPGEALALVPEDVDLSGAILTIRREIAKTRRTHSLPLSPQVVEALRRLIHARHPEWSRAVPLFCTRDGTPLKVRRWEARMRKYSDTLQVTVTPYDLRHSFALLFLRQGGNAYALQRLMGHTTMEMTRRYVNLTGSDVKSQHALASPVNRLVPARRRVGSLPGVLRK